jgi:hypothetical protein
MKISWITTILSFGLLCHNSLGAEQSARPADAAALIPNVTTALSGFTLADAPGSHLDVLWNGQLAGRFMYAWDVSSPERRHETYKPYLHVYDASGSRPITKGAGGSFTHHRGIFIGWNRIQFDGKSFDRWHMNDGEIVHQKFIEHSTTSQHATWTSLIHWNDADGSPFLMEKRTLTFRDPISVLPSRSGSEADAPLKLSSRFIIDFTTHLTAHKGPVHLNGDPEHAGVQFRPADEVDVERTLYVFPKSEAVPQKDLDYPWVGETFFLEDNAHSVVHLNHPDNPKGTRYSAYRDYGRFGAFFVREIPEGETLTLKYRFLIASGEMPSPREVQTFWNLFAGRDPNASADEVEITVAPVRTEKE